MLRPVCQEAASSPSASCMMGSTTAGKTHCCARQASGDVASEPMRSTRTMRSAAAAGHMLESSKHACLTFGRCNTRALSLYGTHVACDNYASTCDPPCFDSAGCCSAILCICLSTWLRLPAGCCSPSASLLSWLLSPDESVTAPSAVTSPGREGSCPEAASAAASVSCAAAEVAPTSPGLSSGPASSAPCSQLCMLCMHENKVDCARVLTAQQTTQV